MKSLGLVVALVLSLAGCGYHVSGHADLLPTTIKTISVPAFTNLTTRYKLTDRLPEAIAREFISKTRYKVAPDSSQPDAVLQGSVVSYQAYPTIFDPVTGRAAGVEMHVVLQMRLIERASGKVLFTRPNFEVRERYEISIDPGQYFEESDAALNRVSQQVARQVVSAILRELLMTPEQFLERLKKKGPEPASCPWAMKPTIVRFAGRH